jgi:hypothetical protein
MQEYFYLRLQFAVLFLSAEHFMIYVGPHIAKKSFFSDSFINFGTKKTSAHILNLITLTQNVINLFVHFSYTGCVLLDVVSTV